MRLKALTGLLAVFCLSGCAGFFPANSTSSATASSTGDYAYVVNQGTNTVSAFAIGSGTLTAVTGSPYTLTTGLSATSVVVSRQDSFVYVGGNGAILCYSIGTGGALTAVSGGGTTVAGDVVSMATSPDGQWLLVLAVAQNGLTADATVYGINASSGVLTQNGQILAIAQGSNSGTVVPKVIRISPNGTLVAAALGTGGDALFTFTTSTGSMVQTGSLSATSNLAGFFSDNALQFGSASTYLYIGSTGLTTGQSVITTYPVSTAAVLGAGTQIASGDSPSALELDSTGTYLYSANRASGNISGYTVATTGVLTALSGSPFAASTQVNSLVRDKSGSYVIGVAGSSVNAVTSDVTLYGYDAFMPPGRLDAIAVMASGTDPANAVAVAATH